MSIICIKLICLMKPNKYLLNGYLFNSVHYIIYKRLYYLSRKLSPTSDFSLDRCVSFRVNPS